jgi:hypothetical protein
MLPPLRKKLEEDRDEGMLCDEGMEEGFFFIVKIAPFWEEVLEGSNGILK